MITSIDAPVSNYQCVVIGTGPAGISVALGLVSANRRVLLIESGGTSTDPSLSSTIGYGHLGRNYWNQHWVRGIGGTSRAWSGLTQAMSDRTFDNSATGVRWPIRRADLMGYYRKAAPILDRDPGVVDQDALFCAGFLYRPFSRQRPTRFAEKYGPLLESRSGIDLITGTSVVGFDSDDSRRIITGLRCFQHGSGETKRLIITARQAVVLAAGGIGNAQLMLQPRDDGSVPVGNESGLVGRFLMEHPHLYGAAEVVIDDDLERFQPPAAMGRVRHAIVADPGNANAKDLLECSLELRNRSTDHELVRYMKAEEGKPFYHYYVNVRTEMLPTDANRVFLTGERERSGLYRPGVRCVFGASDLVNVEMTLRLFGRALIQQRKGRLRINNERLYGSATGGGHIMGTTRMGVNARTSVVDGNCRVHGYDNFYLAGSSVFPTSGVANPTLSIVALATRLADTILQRA